MLNSIFCCAFLLLSIKSVLEFNAVTAKTQFLFDKDEGLPSSVKSSIGPNYRQSSPKFKEPSTRVPQHLQDIQYVKGPAGGDVIHIIDPPSLSSNKKHPATSSHHLRPISQDLAVKFQNAIVDDGSPLNANRPTAAFLIKPQAPNQQEFNHHSSNQLKKSPPKFGPKPSFVNTPDSHGYHFGSPQFYPLKISAAVRHNHIIRHRPTSLIPKVKHRVQFKKFKTFQSEIQKKSHEFDEEARDTQLDSMHTNVTKPVMSRPRRSTHSRHKSGKVMQGSLLPVALTIMGENGELLTGRALLQHITVLLQNASGFGSNEDEEVQEDQPTYNHKYINNKDVILNEKDFHRIMDNSINLTDPVMLTVLAANELNASSLLSNAYVNEYLNCIDSSKSTNRFKALQSKIDCMKRKMFDRSNFDNVDSSRYSISNLPAALVYADVMTNIKNLIRPKKGIAFYSLPVEELGHLQKVVLPIDDYPSAPEQVHSPQLVPSSYQNRQIFFNENIQPRMPVWYVVKSDGRIYQMEGGGRGGSHYKTPVFHGVFPDIPNADGFIDSPPSRLPHFDSVFFDD